MVENKEELIMAKMSLTSRVFECTLRRIFPHKETDKLKKLRRKIYYPILNVWGNYCYCVDIDENGEEIEGAKQTITGFVFWMVSRHVGGIPKHIYIQSGLAPLICKRYGHKLEDLSSAGPESGNADHGCRRCGEYWHVPLY